MEPVEVKKIEQKVEEKIEEGFISKSKKNPWILSTLIFAILALGLVLMNPNISGRITGNVISANNAAQNLLGFYLNNGAEGLSVDSVETESGLYKINFLFQGQVVPIYMTRDGKLAGSLSPLMLSTQTNTQTNTNDNTNVQQTSQAMPKSDKPKVELFVMSYCPYGTQAEKGLLPAVALLGDKIDFKLRFVHYTLHGEKEDIENNRQLCIREEQGQDKLNKYLVCILDSDNPNAPKDVSVCEKEAGIDNAKLQTCLKNKADSYFASDSLLSKNYGVQGSPTLIINGVQSSAGRNPASYLNGICGAFNNAPSECSEQLSITSPSTGFGYKTGTDTVAQC